MQKIELSQDQVLILQNIHRSTKDGKKRDRIKTILFLNRWFSYRETAELLLLDDDTVRAISKKFLEDGMDKFLEDDYVCYCWKLTDEQEEKVKDFVRNNMVMDAMIVVEFIKNEFNKIYTRQWVIDLLHRVWFVFKKTKKVPAKANKINQTLFIYNYRVFKAILMEDEVICFIDWVHPMHNVMNQYWWIEKWKEKEIKSNTWRERININGAYNIETQEIVSVQSERINAQSTIELYKKLEEKYSDKRIIWVYRDNARYYWNALVKEYLPTSRIVEVPLPTYSPNLNPIERLWRFFKREILYNQYYEKFSDFEKVVNQFFYDDFSKYKWRLSIFVTDNFRAMGF